MGPKKGKKGGAGGAPAQGEEAKQGEKISEVDKEWFGIQIKSLEEKLDRRNDKLRRFEERNTDLETQYIQLREDKADVVAFLKRTLQQRTDTIHELTDRLEGMKVAHQDEKQDYERQLAELRAEYTKTKDDLDGEIMVLTKKLDSLEEFRQQKEQLMNKFEKLESDSKQKMEDYEKKIYDLEKSHIREQDRLKKEMMERVENVAGEFRKAAHSQMAATTQRTIRENVNISSQLAQLTEKATNLTSENDKLAVRELQNKTKVSLLEAEIEKLSRRNAYRQKVIEELTGKCRSQEGKMEQVKGFEAERRKYEARIEKLNKQISVLENSVKENKSVAEKTEKAVSETKMSMLEVSQDKTFLDTCLREACQSIQRCLALLSDTTEEVEQKARREDVLNQLLVLLNTAITRKDRGSARRSSSAKRRTTRRRESRLEITLTASTEEEEEEREEGEDGEATNYMSGALGLIPTD